MALLAAGCGSHATMPTAPPPTITALQVVADQKPFDVGSDYRLRAVATMTDGATLNLSSDLKWSTSKTAVLDITPEGVVTAVSAGEAIVTLRWNAFTASTTLRSQQTRSGVFVRGRVTDHVTGAGVASQKVWIADTTTITDVSGSYSAWLPQGGLIYLDLAPSNSPGYSNFFAASGFRGDLLRDSMMCSARYGRVVDYDTGAPLAGVAIREAWAGGKTVPGTSSDGTYRFDICPGIEIGNTAWVQFDLDGYTGYHLGVGRGRMDVRRFDVQLRRTASPVQR
ncbi:MAG: hypothetical protein EPO35_09765 [Acidobacteria bacterium]|nr:MAG: hypothetical protein EPO35_09765 [Acidobacteriota bacterium]